MSTISVVLLLVLLVVLLPLWPYSAGMGPWPSGVVGFLLLVVLILALAGRI